MESPGDPMDAASLLYEVGRQTQGVALAMRNHRILALQELCECGRLPVQRLPILGLRCEVIRAQWLPVHGAMHRIVAQGAFHASRAVGRVAVNSTGAGHEVRLASTIDQDQRRPPMIKVPRTFALKRHLDRSGVSGTGIVAYGTQYPPTGLVTLAWLGHTTGHESLGVYESLAAVEAIHGHHGYTEII
jgi:hypothetical protein